MIKSIALLLMFVIPAPIANSQPALNNQRLAAEVKSEFLHAWNGYKKYAWGHDDLRPLTKSFHDWYTQPLLMTPVDALDTLILMGLKDEADNTRKYILDNLSFDKNIDVQNFEITIRLLGGLLSSYQLTGDRRLLALAEDLGYRLVPVFESPTGLPYKFVNLKTGRVRGAETNPAETGTLLIEFGTLSKLTGKPMFFDKAKRALVETYNRRSPIGLIGTRLNVETGRWTNTDSHISAEIDSYYEYLMKSWLLFDDQESTYHLYHYTKDPHYLRMGETLFRDFVTHCKTEAGYAALKSVVTKEKSDSMQSFLFAETFKYFYLLFAPPTTLAFDKVTFNTEAHPVRKTWK
ncbi:MAG: glycoside hydrolase family 47 protein [Pyrinomonadaceae bacterium]|nr:glycoside hydrolase family 47 protein [Pyrinomonadaceae bacterium]MBA3571329.1 glycoside hydrolase family 47 protein [Pyrinomonadaceae bacterium]